MKKKHFYSHLVEVTHITLELGDLDVAPEERVHLISLVDVNIHSSVIKTVLDNLESDEKKIFLKNLARNDHKRTWKHLKTNIKDAEGLIKKTINETIEELKKDIENSRNSRNQN